MSQTKFEVDRATLFAPLQAAIAAAETRHAVQIFGNALIEFQPGMVKITATDSVMQVSASATADVNGTVLSITTPARRLLDILRKLGGEKVILEPKESTIRLNCAGSRFVLRTMPASDFPLMPAMLETAAEAQLAASDLKRLLVRTLPAMAKDGIRYYLIGGLVIIGGTDMSVVGTDGIRLAMASCAVTHSSGAAQVIVPKKALDECAGLLPDTDECVTVRLSPRQVVFAFGGTQMVSGIVDGSYPNYQSVIPATCAQRFVVDRARLRDSLERSALVLHSKFRGVRWTCAGDELRIEAQHGGEESEEAVPVQHEGDAIEYGLGVDYVLDALDSLRDVEQIECGFNGFDNAMLLAIPGDPTYKCVLMRMKV